MCVCWAAAVASGGQSIDIQVHHPLLVCGIHVGPLIFLPRYLVPTVFYLLFSYS